VAEDRIVALSNVDGEFFALDGICPHQGGPLGKGTLNGCIITCPWHGFQFDVRNGRNVSSPAIVQGRYDVKTEDGEVFVDVDVSP
jgi:nitrite reductase/ring-hydroxylating ferredoxin subunit